MPGHDLSSDAFKTLLDNMLEGCQIIGFDWQYLYVNDAVARHGRKRKDELVGRRMMDVYPGIEATPMFATLAACMRDRTPATLSNPFAHPDGGTSWFELRVEPAEQGLFVMSLDVTKEKEAEATLGRQLRRLAALRAIDIAILGTTDWRVAIRTVLDETRAQLEASAAAILLLKGAMQRLELLSIAGEARAAQIPSIPLGRGLAGQAALERRTVIVHRLDAADPIHALLPNGPGPRAATPLVSRGKLMGVLVVARPTAPDQAADWEQFFEALAGQAAMAIDSGQAFVDLQRANHDLALAYDTTLEGWSRAMDLRDRETEGHTQRVTETVVRLAELAGLDGTELTHLRRGALLHDIGKIGVPDAILLKPGPLSDHELAIMRRHPAIAYDLLSPVSFLRPALDIPYSHHERWDGSGYPRGLQGDAIPLPARLFAVVDVWDALRSNRPYRSAWTERDAIAHLRREAGRLFDPQVVDLFLHVREQRES